MILTKALGVGIYSAAFKKDALSPTAYAETIGSMTLLNRIGMELAKNLAVHAITDVTGFGLLARTGDGAWLEPFAVTVRIADLPLPSDAAARAATLRHRRFDAQLGKLR